MKKPHNVMYLRRAVRHLFDTDEKAYKMRVMMANVVIGQILPDGVVRGGTSMKLRYGHHATRFTMDFDAAQRLDVEEKVGAVCRRLFAYRKQQTWPSNVAYGPDWESLYAEAAKGVDVFQTLDEAIPWGNDFIAKIVRYSKPKGSARRKSGNERVGK